MPVVAGLWEFPSVPLDTSCAPAKAQAALEAYLWGLPGLQPLQGLPRAWSRRQHECSHTFSHIQLSMSVHRLTLQVCKALVYCLVQALTPLRGCVHSLQAVLRASGMLSGI